MHFVGPVALELIVREFDLDRCFPASKTTEDFIGLGRRVVVLELGFWFGNILWLVGVFWSIGSLLFLFVLLLFLLFFIRLIVIGVLSLIF